MFIKWEKRQLKRNTFEYIQFYCADKFTTLVPKIKFNFSDDFPRASLGDTQGFFQVTRD